MSDDAKAFWVTAPGTGEIRRETVAGPVNGEVLVRALFSGISRGTESLVFSGRVPASEYGRMRAPFQSGNFPAPVKYGYASVGTIEQGPRELVNRTVFALYPHQTRYVVPASAVHVVPTDVPPARAVLTANLETAINGIWDAQVQVGDRVTIIGGGTVGCLAAWLANRIAGCEVQLVDVNPRRASAAKALGVAFAEPRDARAASDVVIHASGSPAGLELALSVADFESRIVELSWYGDQTVGLPLGQSFHAKRLSIVSSQVGHVASSQRSRWDHRRRMELALKLLSDTVLDALITGESAFDAMPSVMADLARAPGDTLCHRIRY